MLNIVCRVHIPYLVYTYKKVGKGEEERGVRKKNNDQKWKLKAVRLNRFHESVDIAQSSPYSQGEKHQSVFTKLKMRVSYSRKMDSITLALLSNWRRLDCYFTRAIRASKTLFILDVLNFSINSAEKNSIHYDPNRSFKSISSILPYMYFLMHFALVPLSLIHISEPTRPY